MKFLEPDSYQPNCTALFDKYEAIIHRLLPCAKPEHIGSSAIEGALLKGDLDIFVAIEFDAHPGAI